MAKAAAKASGNRLREMLQAAATPERAAGEAKYLKLEDRENLGVDAPSIHKIALEYVHEFGLPGDLSVIDGWFWASLEEATCAIKFMSVQPAFTAATWAVVEKWCAAPDTWSLADPISMVLAAGHLEEGVISEQTLREWSMREQPFWFRRIALVTTTTLNAGLSKMARGRMGKLGRVPEIGSVPRPRLTLDLLEASIHDKRHFIRLGIGWALRILADVAPDETAEFVSTHRARITKAMLAKARLGEDGRRR